uniref:Putative dehydrogenase n=1 Tax=Streptomyces griseoviridis TaxID=45398 RepID=B6VRR8_STRGD|nr:putative dehydrogenase [Streptomyces griseoviridis]
MKQDGRTPEAGAQAVAGEPFAEALGAATRIAVLSPSSHNCQPWALARVVSPGARRAVAARLGCADEAGYEFLVLALDRRHSLRALPAHSVEMLLSCGAYWWLLQRALAAQGWRQTHRFEPGGDARSTVYGPGHGHRAAPAPDGSPDHDTGRDFCHSKSHNTSHGAVMDLPHHAPHGTEPFRPEAVFGPAWPHDWTLLRVAALRPGEPSGEPLAELREAAAARRTNRAPYLPREIDDALLKDLAAPAADGGSTAATTVRHLRDQGERESFAAYFAAHGGRDYSHRAAWRETHDWVRWTDAEAAARGDGLPLTQLFGPLSGPQRLYRRVTLAPGMMRLLGGTGYPRRIAGGLAQLVRRSSAVVVMSGPGDADGLDDALGNGSRIADYWWRAGRAGLALHPLSVLLQHEDLRLGMQARFGLPERAFFVSRIGYPVQGFPPAPRRAVPSSPRIF